LRRKIKDSEPLLFSGVFSSLLPMTFLNPLALIGLAAASIPLLIHLLSQRRLRTIEFSSVRFLKELQRTSMRRLRIRQILLLVLRTLIIISVVVAFSRPALHGSVAGIAGTDASSTTVLLIDDSPSMTASDDHGEVFPRAREAAVRLIDLVRSGDRFYLIPLSATRSGVSLPPPRTVESARRFLSEIRASFITVPFCSALVRLDTLLRASADANREILFVTDGQASQFDLPESADTAFRVAPGIHVFVLTTPLSEAENLDVESGEVMTRILSPSRPARIRARIVNKGDQPASGVLASVYLEGIRVAQQEASLPPHGAVSEEFTFIPKRTGILTGAIRLEPDSYEADNSWNFALEVPDRIPILLVGPDKDATRLPALAISAGNDSAVGGNFDLRRITESELSAVDLSRFEAVVVCGVRTATVTAIQNLKRFLTSGGGVVLFPDAHVGTFTQFAAGLGLPPPAGQPVTQAVGSYLTFATIDYAHPILEGMFETANRTLPRKPKIESPHVRSFLPLGRSSASESIISLSNGSPFLAEYSLPRGRVLVFAVQAGLTWSDFPTKGIFAPLLHRTVSYAALEGNHTPSITCGEPLRVSLQLREFTDKDMYTLTAPGGENQRLIPTFRPATSEAVFSGGMAGLPGAYTLTQKAFGHGEAERKILAVAVNTPRRESDLHGASDKIYERFSTTMGIPSAEFHVLRADEHTVERIREDRFGVELWRIFLWTAFACAIVEMIVGRSRPQENAS
jgi:hypothetical protein